jgi:hypothetical protein
VTLLVLAVLVASALLNRFLDLSAAGATQEQRQARWMPAVFTTLLANRPQQRECPALQVLVFWRGVRTKQQVVAAVAWGPSAVLCIRAVRQTNAASGRGCSVHAPESPAEAWPLLLLLLLLLQLAPLAKHPTTTDIGSQLPDTVLLQQQQQQQQRWQQGRGVLEPAAAVSVQHQAH